MARRFSPLTLAMSFGLPVYFLCLSIPQVVLTDFWATFSLSAQALIRKWQVIGIVALVVWCGGAVVLRVPKGRINLKAALPWAMLGLWMGASMIWSIRPTDSLLYTLVYAAVIVCGVIYWLLPDRLAETSALLGALALAIGIGYLFTRLPMQGRTVGGVGANLLAHFGFALIALTYLGGKQLRFVSVVAGLGLIAYAQGRTVLIGTVFFLMFYHFVSANVRDRKTLYITIVACFLIGILIVAFLPIISSSVTNISSYLLGVTDSERLNGSGFSGRSRSWEAGFEVLSGHELIGLGFRTRGSLDIALAGLGLNAHSGLLNCTLDLGIIGLVLFLAAYVTSLGYALISWADAEIDSDRVAVSFLVGMLPILAVEPNYLNFASPSHFVMALCLAKPISLRFPARIKNSEKFPEFADRRFSLVRTSGVSPRSN